MPEGSGRPYQFGPWVQVAAQGRQAENHLPDRIQKIWKTDLFLTLQGSEKYLAATVKSNSSQLEGGRGLRLGIVPESPRKGNKAGVKYNDNHNLWTVTLSDPDGFTGLYNDCYKAVARAIYTLGRHPQPAYHWKPSAKAQKLQEQLEKMGNAKVLEVEDALNEAAQQKLVKIRQRLLSVNAPSWLHFKQLKPKLIAPKPKFHTI